MNCNSGYIGWSKSVRASNAESEGKLPASKGYKEWGFKSIAALKRHIKSTEYHHTSKYFNCTDYYDFYEWINNSELTDLCAALSDMTKKGRLILSNEIRRKIKQNIYQSISINYSRHKSVFSRQNELRIKYNLPQNFSFPRDLSNESIKESLRADNRKQFVLKMKKQMIVSSCRKQPKLSNRIEELKLKYGSAYSKAIIRLIKQNKLDFSDKNWLLFKSQLIDKVCC